MLIDFLESAGGYKPGDNIFLLWTGKAFRAVRPLTARQELNTASDEIELAEERLDQLAGTNCLDPLFDDKEWLDKFENLGPSSSLDNIREVISRVEQSWLRHCFFKGKVKNSADFADVRYQSNCW